MSSTPLFDSLRQVRTTDAATPPAPRSVAVPAAQQPVPASPIDAPALVHDATAAAVAVTDPSASVPAGLVSAIDAIPARLRASLAREHQVSPEDLPFVEAIADALTRAVVDAVVSELDRIATTGLVRG
jgi:hypothetical protein